MTLGRVTVSWPFVFFLFILLLFCPLEDLLPILLAAMIHEMGHCTAIFMSGGKLDEIALGLAGAELCYQNGRLSYFKDRIIAASGPLANFLTGMAAAFIFAPGWRYFTGLSMIYCFFNLLPALPLDGGRILYAFIAEWRGSESAEHLLGMVTPVILSVLSACGAAIVFYCDGNPSLLVVASAAFLALWQKNALQGRRKKL